MDALLIVDMQVGCFAGDPPRLDREGLVARINILAEKIRARGAVVFIQHTVAEDGYAKGSHAWQLLPELKRREGDKYLEKVACDSFLQTELESMLQNMNVTRVIIVGCATDFCVDTTVRAAAAKEFDVIVPSDGHTTRNRPHLNAEKIIEHHNYMWADLLLPGGKKVRVIPMRTLIAEWEKHN